MYLNLIKKLCNYDNNNISIVSEENDLKTMFIIRFIKFNITTISISMFRHA